MMIDECVFIFLCLQKLQKIRDVSE